MKKIISMLLAFAIMITFMVPVMASSSTSADMGLKNAIKAVKEKIDIPEDCNKFTYNIYNQEGLISWNLGWSNEESQKSINVTIDENNLITNYNSYDNKSYEKKIPKYTKEQGLEIAEKFINKLDPKLLQQYKLIENNANSYYTDSEYNFNYTRQKDEINYSMNNINVNINSYTGEVTNYNCNFSKNTTFEDASKIISIEQAKKAFIEKLGLKLVYNVKTENEKTSTYLAYIPKNPNKYIDALTGEAETTDNRYGIYYDEDMVMAQKSMVRSAAGETANIALTPDEINAIDGMSGLLSKDDIDKKLRANDFLNLDSEFTLTNAYLSKDRRNNETLIWSFSYTKKINKDTNETRAVSVSVDARSGEIQNFWTYYPSVVGAKPQKTKDQAKEISDDLLKSIIPSNYSNFKYDDNYFNYVDDKTKNQFTFRYVRVENDIECPSDYVNITYDNLSGNVIGMDSNWNKNLKFDAPKPAISI
ncbi:MAG: YcdB/YcdC domain-containing protein, partial [Ruminiclostridium sp.]